MRVNICTKLRWRFHGVPLFTPFQSGTLSRLKSAAKLEETFLVPYCISPFFGAHSWFSSRSLLQNQEKLHLRLVPDASTETKSVVNFTPANKRVTSKIRRLSKQERWSEAKQLFDNTSVKDTILYNVIIDAATSCKKYDEGLKLFFDMKKTGVKITSAEYSAVLKLLGRKGDYCHAKQIWMEYIGVMVEAGQDPWRNWQLQSQDHSSENMIDGNPTKVCFTGLLNAGACSGNADAVVMHLSEAIQKGAKLNRVHFGCLIKVYRHLRSAKYVQRVLQDMRNYAAPASIIEYTLAMGACTQDVAAAYDLHKAQSYVAMIRGEMSKDQIAPNEYFVEEEVATLLGAGWLSNWEGRSLSPPPEAVAAALCSLEGAFAQGIRKTRMLRRVEARLQSLA